MKKSPEPPITCVIPTFTNTTGLRKLVHFLNESGYPTIIVDNNPTPEKKLLFEANSLYLPQAKNLGFAAAVNRAAQRAQTEWLAILNDDIKIKNQDLFVKLLKFALKNNYAAVTPVLKNPNGEIENLGYQVSPIGRINLIKNVARYTLHVTRGELDGLTAACLLIKKRVFEKLGGFDERFFAYLEDVDLFLRLKKLGEKFGVCGNLAVVHNHMATSAKMGNFKQKQDFKNWLLLIVKNWDRKTMIIHFPEIVIERLRNLSGLIKSILS